MQSESNKNRLVLIHGGPDSELEGPAKRLGLYERFPALQGKQLAIVVATKVALLLGILYFIYA